MYLVRLPSYLDSVRSTLLSFGGNPTLISIFTTTLRVPPPTIPDSTAPASVLATQGSSRDGRTYGRGRPRGGGTRGSGGRSNTIDKVIPATSQPPPMAPAPDDLPNVFRKRLVRLVARGFTQQHGIDYEKTFSPVAKLNTVRVLVSFVVHRSWLLYYFDIKNTFLHGDLTDTVYMLQPPGYETAGENHVCRHRKSLYNLKQSPRALFEKFSKVVHVIGFSRSSADSSQFVHRRSQETMILLVYVDDIIITGDDTAEIVKVKAHLSKQFHIKDLDTLKYFLGIEVAKKGKSFLLNQRKYCLDLLKESEFLGCKPVDTPMKQNLKFSNFTDESDIIILNPDMH
ncbi:Retrovirus-related Pol polyprotein from transposon RE1-like protein [Drosera capensis]